MKPKASTARKMKSQVWNKSMHETVMAAIIILPNGNILITPFGDRTLQMHVFILLMMFDSKKIKKKE